MKFFHEITALPAVDNTMRSPSETMVLPACTIDNTPDEMMVPPTGTTDNTIRSPYGMMAPPTSIIGNIDNTPYEMLAPPTGTIDNRMRFPYEMMVPSTSFINNMSYEMTVLPTNTIDNTPFEMMVLPTGTIDNTIRSSYGMMAPPTSIIGNIDNTPYEMPIPPTGIINNTMRFPYEIVFPPTGFIDNIPYKMMVPSGIDYSTISLHRVIVDSTSRELGFILNCVSFHMTHQYKQELESLAPADSYECIRVVNIWVTRLIVIRSALANFPTLMSGTGTNTSAHSTTIPYPAARTTSAPHTLTTPIRHDKPCPVSEIDCLERDQYQCIITGRKSSDGFTIEVAHIIPLAIANHPSCRHLDFWRMLEMFYGIEATDALFSEVLGKINSPENLISLDSSIHSMFVNGSLNLKPLTKTFYPIHPLYHYKKNYWLSMDYPEESATPEFLQLIKNQSIGEVATPYPRGPVVPITYSEKTPGHAHPLPRPFLALRAFILSKKHFWEYFKTSLNAPSPLGATLTPSPISYNDTWNGQTTDRAAYHATGTDPVLAASAILQKLVDSGALGRSP